MKQFRRMILAATILVTHASVVFSVAEERSAAPEWQKSVGSLHASLVVTDEVEKYGKGWPRPLKAVPMREVGEVTTGTPFFALVAFTGCAPDEAGLCDLTASTRVQFPDGNVIDMGPANVWVGNPPPEPGYIELGLGVAELFFEPGDPAGDFTITTRVHDRNSGARLDLSKKIKHTGADE